ncbi:MAG: hypothetical protein IPO92_06410 [Saprospiraceae bacterium]|nr:hypothetical protein [Saprospiraceae bacterium]
MKYSLVLLSFFFITCKSHVNNTPPQNNPLLDEVMLIHDKVMPETATIHAYIRELKDLNLNEAKDIIYQNIQSLEIADEAMMSWMADFKVPEDSILVKITLSQKKIKLQT